MLAEAIYKGATRPAMKAGVPLVPLVVLCGAGMLVVLWFGTLLSWWALPAVLTAMLPLWVAMHHVTRRDDQRLHQWALAARLRWHDRNHRFWRARSYAGYGYREAV